MSHLCAEDLTDAKCYDLLTIAKCMKRIFQCVHFLRSIIFIAKKLGAKMWPEVHDYCVGVAFIYNVCN